MSQQAFALAIATLCAGFGVYSIAKALTHMEPTRIRPMAYWLFGASAGLSVWAAF